MQRADGLAHTHRAFAKMMKFRNGDKLGTAILFSLLFTGCCVPMVAHRSNTHTQILENGLDSPFVDFACSAPVGSMLVLFLYYFNTLQGWIHKTRIQPVFQTPKPQSNFSQTLAEWARLFAQAPEALGAERGQGSEDQAGTKQGFGFVPEETHRLVKSLCRIVGTTAPVFLQGTGYLDITHVSRSLGD